MLRKDILEAISRNTFFANIEKNFLSQLDDSIFKKKTYYDGETIIKQNDMPQEMFLIISGTARITKNVSDGSEIELFTRGAGDFIGEFALISEKQRSANVYSVGTTEIISINKENFFHLLLLMPKIEYNIAKNITSKMIESDDKTTSELERNIELIALNKKIEAQKLELKKINATKDKFFSIIAHDIKNPLTVTIGFSDILKQYYHELDEDEIISLIDGINTSSKNLLKLLENLLDWSRSQTGRIKFEPTRIDISLIVSSIIALLLESAIAKNIKLTSTIKSNTYVFVDINMITTVLRNLISNAIKFTNSGGHIIIDSNDNKDFLTISVSDDGVGISEENQKKLFRIDEQYTTTGTNEEIGTGIGLILCKEFIEKHNGKIWVESKIGEGSTFFFTLPKNKPKKAL